MRNSYHHSLLPIGLLGTIAANPPDVRVLIAPIVIENDYLRLPCNPEVAARIYNSLGGIP